MRQGLYSSVAERQSCKLKVLGSIPSGGFDVDLWHCFRAMCWADASIGERITEEQGVDSRDEFHVDDDLTQPQLA